MNDLEKLTTATRMLAEVSSAKEAWDLTRTAEAARQYAMLRNLGHESINYATGIKAKAMILLADLVDEGQLTGSIATVGRPKASPEEEKVQTLVELGLGDNANQAAKAVHEARRLRESLGDQDIDRLVAEANDRGEDLGIRGLRRMAADKRVPEEITEPVPLPTGVYRTVTMDPPWDMRRLTGLDKGNPDESPTLDYPTLPSFCRDGKCLRADCKSVQCVVGRVLESCLAEDAHVYVWTTHRFLPDALALAKSWGLHYQCLMTWAKGAGMVPFSWKFDTEFVLFCHRGNLKLERMGMSLLLQERSTGHSIKPEIFYERVTEASPEPRLELFARKTREGFSSWGNEIPAQADQDVSSVTAVV